MINKCSFCRGQIERRLVDFEGRWGDRLVVISVAHIPGERFIEVPVRKYEAA
jgi:hypothetical protein